MNMAMKMTAGALVAALAAGCSTRYAPVKPVDAAKAAAEPGMAEEEGLLLLVLPGQGGEAEVETGRLRLGQGAAPLAPEDTQTKIQDFGPVAQVTVSQTFRNTTGRTVDAAWLLPVPLFAVVMDLTVDIGDRHFRAVTVEEAQAEKLYAAALAQGRHAAMVRAKEAGWQLSLGQVKAGEKVGTGVVYGEVRVQNIPAGDGEFSVVRNGERVKLSWTAGEVKEIPGSRKMKEVRNAKGELTGFEGTSAFTSSMGYQFELLDAPSVTDDHAEAFPVYAALWASSQIQALAFADRCAGRPDHAREILDLARKHKIVCPGMSLLMVDAKK